MISIIECRGQKDDVADKTTNLENWRMANEKFHTHSVNIFYGKGSPRHQDIGGQYDTSSQVSMPLIDTKCNMDIFATWMKKNNTQKAFILVCCLDNLHVNTIRKCEIEFIYERFVWRTP